MCERYVAFVKDYGLEVLEWRDKKLTKDLQYMFKHVDTYNLIYSITTHVSQAFVIWALM